MPQHSSAMASHVLPSKPEKHDSRLVPLRDRRMQSSTGPSPVIDVSCSSSTVTYEQATALNCTHIGGDLLILHTAVTTLALLSGLATVTGSLTIALNTALSSLAGLETLTSIRALSIVHNNALVDLHGLSNVAAVSGNIYVVENNQLADIHGLCRANVSGSMEVRMSGFPYVDQNYCLYTSTFSDKPSLQAAANLWCSNSASAASLHGNISTWNVGLVTDMSHLFDGCISLGHADLSRWDVRRVTTMQARAGLSPTLLGSETAPRQSNRQPP
jgi:surface protein